MGGADTCQGKTALYDIRTSDEPLIQAAKELGAWLAAQIETTEAQRPAISRMLAFLARLPLPPDPDLNGEFAVEIVPDDDDNPEGVTRSWTVSVWRACLEIFSIYSEHARNDSLDGSEFELSWLLCPGELNQNSDFNVSSWIAEVANPRSLVVADHHLVIDASIWETSDDTIPV